MPRAEKKKYSGFPAISLRQPNAGRIIRGEKSSDTRSRPTRFRGWLLLHASKTAVKKTEDGERGKILGLVQLEDCVKKGDRWTYVWKKPRRFRTAISCRGHYSIPFYVPRKLLRGIPAAKIQPGKLGG
jgi:hypothetical protein